MSILIAARLETMLPFSEVHGVSALRGLAKTLPF